MVPMRRVSVWFGLLLVFGRRPYANHFCGQSTRDINGIRIKLFQMCKNSSNPTFMTCLMSSLALNLKCM